MEVARCETCRHLDGVAYCEVQHAELSRPDTGICSQWRADIDGASLVARAARLGHEDPCIGWGITWGEPYLCTGYFGKRLPVRSGDADLYLRRWEATRVEHSETLGTISVIGGYSREV